jgi:uncharacterized protein (DUF1330 family)
MKKLITLLLLAALAATATSTAVAQTEKKGRKGKKANSSQMSDVTPKSVIHVVTVIWKSDATPEQIQAALDGVKKLPASFPGITRVWTRSIKVQNPPGTEKKRTHAFVMEFASEQALKDYHNSPAQLEWYKLYEPVRDQSTTHDITN